MWYKAMCNALMCEITNPQRLNTEKAISGFERATGFKPDRSELCGFCALGRFALDKGQVYRTNERARAGFWVGVPEEIFWLRKRGAAEWWDGHCFRVVVNNFYVYE
jgi:hypothetical protein